MTQTSLPFSPSGANWVVVRDLAPLLRAEADRATGVVADLGCGVSPYRPLFSKAQSYLRVDQVSDDPEVMLADALHLPFAPASIDTILFFQVIGDLPDIVAALGEVVRVLAPGGRILIYESVAFPEHDLPHDFWRVMPQGLTWAAGAAGLKVETLVPLGGLFARLAILLNSQVFCRLRRYVLLRPLAAALIIANNFLCGALDRLFLIKSSSPDYFACLTLASPGDPPSKSPS